MMSESGSRPTTPDRTSIPSDELEKYAPLGAEKLYEAVKSKPIVEVE